LKVLQGRKARFFVGEEQKAARGLIILNFLTCKADKSFTGGVGEL
jgi:hypothetical protein